jgi:hypothetical protein
MAPVSEVILVSPQCVLAAEVGIAQDREPPLPRNRLYTVKSLYKMNRMRSKIDS